MATVIRLVREDDAAQILEIYRPIVLNTVISFEHEPPTLIEMGERITKILRQYPWLVCDINGAIAGYAYASLHRSRAAYQWSVEVSAYVHEGFRQRGVAKALYTALFEVLALQGYFVAFAGIVLPNMASVRLHVSIGFEHIGVYHQIGYKHGAWRDMGWWEKSLQERAEVPQPPQPIGHIASSDEVSAILERAVAMVRG